MHDLIFEGEDSSLKSNLHVTISFFFIFSSPSNSTSEVEAGLEKKN